jgi:hypothetical protein
VADVEKAMKYQIALCAALCAFLMIPCSLAQTIVTTSVTATLTQADKVATFNTMAYQTPLQLYSEGGLTFNVSSGHNWRTYQSASDSWNPFKESFVGGYFGLAGEGPYAWEPYSIKATNGTDFSAVELRAGHGFTIWYSDKVYLGWIIKNNGAMVASGLSVVDRGGYVKFSTEAPFDEILLGAYNPAAGPVANAIFEGGCNGLYMDEVSAVSAIPEPSTYASLVGLGALIAAAGRRLRRRSVSAIQNDSDNDHRRGL